MTDTPTEDITEAAVLDLYFGCETQPAADDIVTLQTTKADGRIVFEFHLPREALEPTDEEGKFRVRWADAKARPYQVTRGTEPE